MKTTVISSVERIPDKLTPKDKIASIKKEKNTALPRSFVRLIPAKTAIINIVGYNPDKVGDIAPNVPKKINNLAALGILLT